MARMIPERPADDCESRAERRLFERLRDETSDDFVAFHHVAWLVPGDRGRPRQGETDFVIAHPRLGILAIEVKGGSIRFDATTGRWSSTGKEGESSIKDPFGQARRASFLLRDALERAKGTGGRRFSVGYAVAFPDTRTKAAKLRLDAPRDVVLDHDDLRDVEARLETVFRYWLGEQKTEPLGKAGLSLVESVLANSFELRAPLAFELEEHERELMRLTEEQYRYLDLLARQPRAAISGCAGSGKTFLAAEKARRLAKQGFRVLFLCYNELLAQHLRRGLADVDEIDVFRFDELCLEIVREAGGGFAESPRHGQEGAYYGTLRKAFADLVDVAAGRYGALIVDEAQDFHPDWWLPLQLLLEDPDESPLYVFYDDNQRIFGVPKHLPIHVQPFQLTRNCRNTRTINGVVSAYYEGATIEAQGPEGIPVDRHFYATEKELLAQLDESVRGWVRDAEVKPSDIALLTPRSAERSALWRVDKLGGVELTDDPWEERKVLRSSIGRFKGLERLVVAVVELDGARDSMLYVGFSRPSVFLSIFCPSDARKKLPAELVKAA